MSADLGLYDVVLRAAGRSFDVERFVRRYRLSARGYAWRRGERQGRSQAPASDSGFSVLVAAGSQWATVWRRARRRIQEWSRSIAAARRMGAEVWIDVAVSPGLAGGPVVLAVLLERDDQRFLVARGVEFMVTAYNWPVWEAWMRTRAGRRPTRTGTKRPPTPTQPRASAPPRR
jgi:hypothetical protein